MTDFGARMNSYGGEVGENDEGTTEIDRFNDRMDRNLALLRIGNNTMIDTIEQDDPEDAFGYQPTNVVLRMHNAPRGVPHTNKLATVLIESDNAYVNGLKSFVGIFIIAPFVIWFVVLFALKLRYDCCQKLKEGKGSNNFIIRKISQIPTPRTLLSDDHNAKEPSTPPSINPAASQKRDNASTEEIESSAKVHIPLTAWIAGGAVIDMGKLKKAGLSRKERRKIVHRSWRIQSYFLTASILIPVLSVVLMELGWEPLEKAIQEVQELNSDVETLAYRGWNAVDGLEASKNELFTENELIRSILEYSHANRNERNRKQYVEDAETISRLNHNFGSINHDGGGHRRAQMNRRPGMETFAPTSPFTSDFDAVLRRPWADMATSSPEISILDNPVKVDVDESFFGEAKAKLNNKDKTTSNAIATTPPKAPQQEQKLQNSAENINNTSKGSEVAIETLSTNNSSAAALESFFEDSPTNNLQETSMMPRRGIFIEDWCPDAIRFIGAEELKYWTDSINNLTEKTRNIDLIFNSLEDAFPDMEASSSSSSSNSVIDDVSPTMHASSAFRFVTDTTSYVDDTIEWFFANDWILKLLIMILNVLNGLLLANVYFLSKNNVIHQPTRMYLTYVLVPLFAITAISIVVVTVAAGVAILVNSDFCSGGSGDVTGPQGTIEDAIFTLQQQRVENGATENHALNLVYDAVDYYWTGCLTENPLEFLEEFSDEIDDAVARVNQFTLLLPIDGSDPFTSGMDFLPEQALENSSFTAKNTLEILNKACDRDMSFLPPAVHDLKRQVDRIKTHINQLSDTMSCGQISPLFRRISHGAVCVDSPERLAVLWGASFGIAILCFVLLTVRAALYNSIKYKKRRPTKPRRVVEKEFEEYKEFMGKYYGEEATKEWKLDGNPLPPTKLQFEFDEDIEMKGTFETAKSSKDSRGGSLVDDDSEHAGIFIRKVEEENKAAADDESSYGSSYDSECSDDSKSIDSDIGDEHSSAIGSFFSETKSIAMRTIYSLRNIKSRLPASNKKRPLPSLVGNSNPYFGRNLRESNEENLDKYDNKIFFSAQPDLNTAMIVDDSHLEDDDRSNANSISDDSLYLPTPTSQAGRQQHKTPTPAATYQKKSLLSLSKDNNFCDEDEEDVEQDELLLSHHSFTPNIGITEASPIAPRKQLSFLARTLYTGKEHDKDFVFEKEDYTYDELKSLVQPKQLTDIQSYRPSTMVRETVRIGRKPKTTKSGKNAPIRWTKLPAKK